MKKKIIVTTLASKKFKVLSKFTNSLSTPDKEETFEMEVDESSTLYKELSKDPDILDWDFAVPTKETKVVSQVQKVLGPVSGDIEIAANIENLIKKVEIDLNSDSLEKVMSKVDVKDLRTVLSIVCCIQGLIDTKSHFTDSQCDDLIKLAIKDAENLIKVPEVSEWAMKLTLKKMAIGTEEFRKFFIESLRRNVKQYFLMSFEGFVIKIFS